MTWHDVGAVDALGEDGVIGATAGDVPVAVFRLGTALHALHDLCPHGKARFSDGYVEDGCVECPLHQGLVDIATGEPRSAPITERVRTYPVRVAAGRIEVAA